MEHNKQETTAPVASAAQWWASNEWIQQLRVVAEQAQKDWAGNIVGWHPASNLQYIHDLDKTDAAFISQARPDTILALLDRLAASPALSATGAAEWISVSERLPEADCRILAVFAPGAYSNTTREPVLALFQLIDQFDRPNQFIIGGGYNPANKFTHWMRLPVAPAVGETTDTPQP